MKTYKQDDIIALVKQKSGYFKKDLKAVFAALDSVLIETLANAELDDPVEIKLFEGVVIQAKREPERPAKDPRNGELIIAREKIKPNVKLKKTYQWKVEKVAGIFGGYEDESQ